MLRESGHLHFFAAAIKEQRPYRAFGLGRQVAVAQGDVDARLEGVVKRLDAVGGEEQDALEVLEQTQENGHEGVAVQVVYAALLQKHIGFVKEEDGAPVASIA